MQSNIKNNHICVKYYKYIANILQINFNINDDNNNIW